MHLVDFIIRIYHDAWSPEHQLYLLFLRTAHSQILGVLYEPKNALCEGHICLCPSISA